MAQHENDDGRELLNGDGTPFSDEIRFVHFDYLATKYSRDRKAKYDLLNQDEMRFDDQVNGTTTWVDAINAIKAAHPKP